MPTSHIRLTDDEKDVLQAVHDMGGADAVSGRGFDPVTIDEILHWVIVSAPSWWLDESPTTDESGYVWQASERRELEGCGWHLDAIEALRILTFCGLVEFHPNAEWSVNSGHESWPHEGRYLVVNSHRTIREGGCVPNDWNDFQHEVDRGLWCIHCLDRTGERDCAGCVETVFQVNRREVWRLRHQFAQREETACHAGWRLTPRGLYVVRTRLADDDDETREASCDAPVKLRVLPESTADDPEALADPRRPPAVNDRDIAILKVLASFPGRLYSAVEVRCVSEKTAKRRIRQLIRQGLVVRPSGPKGGAQITPEGLELLSQLPQKYPKADP